MVFILPFFVPNINREAPLQRYHWIVLFEGMKNSLTICQWFVAKVLTPVCEAYSQVVIDHYMDDILLAAKDTSSLDMILSDTITAIQRAGLTISEEKVQRSVLWKYLGYQVSSHTVQLQHLQLNENPRTLHNMKKHLGPVMWVRLPAGDFK